MSEESKEEKPVEAEVVENLPAKAEEKTEIETVKIGRRNATTVFLPATPEEKLQGKTGEIITFSNKETLILDQFLKTKDYEKTAAATKIEVESVKRILRRPNIRKFLNELISKAAIAESTDLNLVIKEMRLVWEGKIKPTAIQMDAAKTLAKILTPKSPAVVAMSQTNVYNYDDKGLNDEWASAREAAR
jgi:hypothetical protein